MKYALSVYGIVLFLILQATTACGESEPSGSAQANGPNTASHAAKPVQHSRQTPSTGQQEPKNSTASPVIISDIDHWDHPIKPYFIDRGLSKIVFPTKEYPVFYMWYDWNLTEVINDYLNGTTEAMLKANGYWDFEIRTPHHQIAVKTHERKLVRLSYDGQDQNLEQLRKEYNLIDAATNARWIKKNKKTGYFYWRSPVSSTAPSNPDDLYLYYVLSFSEKNKNGWNEYVIEMPRSSDTVIARWYAKVENGAAVFYGETGENLAWDLQQVRGLFAKRFGFKSSVAGTNYDITCDAFLMPEGLYRIRLTQKSGEQENIFYYDGNSNQFYKDAKRQSLLKKLDLP
ncbi:hypothetical protein ACFSR7_25280 [Cohnella sp. GCM10020058]|uniref:hypothetical protein n=1 Tax=Cohnella sp. GCM10020058 TaxID=3317330 RepID=UPI003645AD55